VGICAEPEYTAMLGFVLNQQRGAIVSNWVGADGMSQVTDTCPTLREFGDAAGHAHAHSIMSGRTPTARNAALAAYLDLNWDG